MSLYVLSITSHFLAITRSVATLYYIVFDIFLSNRRVDISEKLLDHPSVSSKKDGMEEQSPYDASVGVLLALFTV